MKPILFISALCSFFLMSCENEKNKKEKSNNPSAPVQNTTGYVFATPTASWELPTDLKEISGIGLINDSVMLCQEDEKGVLYLYNLSTKQIDRTISFGKPDDYEDLAIVGQDVYVLKSNGNVHLVAGYLQTPAVTKYKTTLSGKNDTEGLCYDPVSKSFLITCKEEQGLAEAPKSTKAVYSFNFKAGEDNAGKTLLVFEEKDFKASAVAVHPVTGNIFVLSAGKRKLVELNRAGKLMNRYELSNELFKQPEGLTFAANGDLYISNEADGGKATIHLFKYQP
ncbi:MAG: SdiA-regulated domain-containing protein [Chitinophagaceae bacterium]|jgi:uncharacterized protein YjiK|nr:SdiA-regulated domain-containing protein [Chitinophagaceae bacterium]